MRIRAEIVADFFERVLVGDQLFRVGKIDAVVAGVPVRRAGDAHVHFLRAGFAQIHHARARRGAAHDRVIHHHHALSRPPPP